MVDPTPTAFALPSLLTVGNVRSAELTNFALKYTSSLAPPVPYPPPLLAILTEEIPLNPWSVLVKIVCCLDTGKLFVRVLKP